MLTLPDCIAIAQASTRTLATIRFSSSDMPSSGQRRRFCRRFWESRVSSVLAISSDRFAFSVWSFPNSSPALFAERFEVFLLIGMQQLRQRIGSLVDCRTFVDLVFVVALYGTPCSKSVCFQRRGGGHGTPHCEVEPLPPSSIRRSVSFNFSLVDELHFVSTPSYLAF